MGRGCIVTPDLKASKNWKGGDLNLYLPKLAISLAAQWQLGSWLWRLYPPTPHTQLKRFLLGGELEHGLWLMTGEDSGT